MDWRRGSDKERLSVKRDGPASGSDGPKPVTLRKCQECHRAGVARSHTVGICEECDVAIAEEVHERVETIKEALRKLRAEARVGAKFELWDLILAQTEALLTYEEREILTTCPPPSALLQDFRALRDAVLGPE